MRTSVPADYGYSLEAAPDHFAVSYNPGRYGPLLYAKIFVLLTVVIWALLSLSSGLRRQSGNPQMDAETLLIAPPLVALAAVLLGYYVTTAFLRKRKTINISARGIEAEGKLFSLEHISSIFVKSPQNPTVRQSEYVVVGSPAMVSGMAAAHSAITGLDRASAHIDRMENAKHGWSIWIDYGMRPYLVAPYLSESRANLMFKEITDIIENGFDSQGNTVARAFYPVEGEGSSFALGAVRLPRGWLRAFLLLLAGLPLFLSFLALIKYTREEYWAGNVLSQAVFWVMDLPKPFSLPHAYGNSPLPLFIGMFLFLLLSFVPWIRRMRAWGIVALGFACVFFMFFLAV